MKNLDLIQLVDDKAYKKNNLEKNMHGVIVEAEDIFSKVLFFNPQNLGEYIILQLKNSDFIVCKEQIPNDIKEELILNLDNLISKANDKFDEIKIKDYDLVELIVEDDKYTKFGVHKGDLGCVMDCKAIQNYIEVDFSYINEKGEFCGDCIAVKIDDVKIVK